MISVVRMNNQKTPKLVKLVMYTWEMYNAKEENELGRKYEPGNTKNQTKQC